MERLNEKFEEKLDRIEKLLLATQKNVFTLDELVSYTGLSKSCIYKKTHYGEIPHYKQAKHLYFDKKEIDEWLKTNKGFSREDINKIAATYITLNKKGGVGCK